MAPSKDDVDQSERSLKLVCLRAEEGKHNCASLSDS
jgi:hypothetical protein